jgi:hypothetical protein
VSAAVITASASILVAVLVFILNQHAQFRQERRRAQLARVSSQLRELYGPLNALVDVNEQIWEALHQSRLPTRAERLPDAGTEDWRRWRDHALMPANRRMRDLIIEHADLLVGSTPTLRDFCAHVTSLEIVLVAEAEGMNEASLIQHPGAAYASYVRSTYEHLKDESNACSRKQHNQPYFPENRQWLYCRHSRRRKAQQAA